MWCTERQSSLDGEVLRQQSNFTNSTCVCSLSPCLCLSNSNPTTTSVATTTTAIAKLNGGQTTPLDVSGLSQSEIQGLLLGAHPSGVSPGSVVVPAASPSLEQQHHLASNGVLMSQGSIKREPEDLRKDSSKGQGGRIQKVSNWSTSWTAGRFSGWAGGNFPTQPKPLGGLSETQGRQEGKGEGRDGQWSVFVRPIEGQQPFLAH